MPRAAAPAPELDRTIDDARRFYQTGGTLPLAFRLERLRAFRAAISAHEAKLFDALGQDVGKCRTEAYASEIGPVYAELKHALRHLGAWMKPREVSVPLSVWPASGYRYPEPRGTVLILSPWNYPFHLAAAPLVGAIAAGCTAVVKPSEVSAATSSVFAEIVASAFGSDGYVSVVHGDATVAASLLVRPWWDLVVFTGSSRAGSAVMQAAAKHLSPVVLELGGKSPVIVAADTELAVAARRIVWGKFTNAGQSCIAPDYVLVPRRVGPTLLRELGSGISAFYGQNPLSSPDYGRIASTPHFDRLMELVAGGRVFEGGEADRNARYIAPTLLTDVDIEHPLMQEEIFGPLLPVLEVDDVEQAIRFVQQRPKPLTLYLFTSDGALAERVLERIPFGGGAVNDTLMHWLPLELPFGGVAPSGMGAYHGKASFDAFSHTKSVLKGKTGFDSRLRYPPYKTPLAQLRPLHES